ncbi:hypothetical protein N657DRAFT_423413 [Parathielavia appendiculata]|uniref:Uncharacterized protein n=1 Tax=Parathielavia appendiculata TaxID=2587402 RepID=A0AAN6TZQ6_9PEZI|nr:hypothetical protein N657DRAFT_423413 [Parathielavia appendiculata]
MVKQANLTSSGHRMLLASPTSVSLYTAGVTYIILPSNGPGKLAWAFRALLDSYASRQASGRTETRRFQDAVWYGFGTLVEPRKTEQRQPTVRLQGLGNSIDENNYAKLATQLESRHTLHKQELYLFIVAMWVCRLGWENKRCKTVNHCRIELLSSV